MSKDTFRKEDTSLDDQQKQLMLQIKEAAETLEGLYDTAMRESFDMRMLKIAHTNLEQSVMWGVKAVTGERKMQNAAGKQI